MTLNTKEKLTPEWDHYCFVQTDNPDSGLTLDFPIPKGEEFFDQEQLRFYTNHDDEGWISQECIGQNGYYYSDGAGLHDTSISVERNAVNPYVYTVQQNGVDIELCFTGAVNGRPTLALTHDWGAGEKSTRSFQSEKPITSLVKLKQGSYNYE